MKGQEPLERGAITHPPKILVQDPRNHGPSRLPVDEDGALGIHLAQVLSTDDGPNVRDNTDIHLLGQVPWITHKVKPCNPGLGVGLKLLDVNVQSHLLGPMQLGGVACLEPVERVVHELHRKRERE